MTMPPGVAALAVAAGLLLSGCSASPQPITAEVAQELQAEVQGIASLAARGDTADAVAAAHALAAKVRTAQTDGRITSERAIVILERVEQLIERLVRSGAAPAPADLPQSLDGPAAPVAPLSPPPETEPPETGEPTGDSELSKTPDPAGSSDPAETLDPVVPEPIVTPESDSSGGAGSSGSDSGSSGPTVPVPVVVDEAGDGDDNGGKGRGRGRSSDD